MKKEVFIMFILIVTVLAGTVNAECKYYAGYDKDSDNVMGYGAKCGVGYQYDCDDNDPTVYDDCKDSLWKRILQWFSGRPNESDIIAGNAVRSVVPTPDPVRAIGAIKESIGVIAPQDCSVTICWQGDDEVYCPYGHARCVQEYEDCRIVYCAESEDETEYTYAQTEDRSAAETEYYTADSCTEEYHNCYDDGQAVICKGEFSRCDEAFDDCTCGTDDTGSYGETAQPEIDTADAGDCTTGVYVCKRQVITMAGDVADSTVTCKGTFAECSMVYGGCECGDSSLTDFPTQYIGSAGYDEECPEDAQGYWCAWKDRQVPCYMIDAECNQKRNTCYKDTGVKIICQGTFEYCSKQYAGECLCGIEMS